MVALGLGGVVVLGLGGVVVTTGGRLDLVYVALNPLEVSVASVLKRTTIVLLLDSTGLGILPPQNLPLMDSISVLAGGKYSQRLKQYQHLKIPMSDNWREAVYLQIKCEELYCPFCFNRYLH